MTGADAMVKCLEAQGIGVVFGYPGVAIAPFYNSLYDSNIKSIWSGRNRTAAMRPADMPV